MTAFVVSLLFIDCNTATKYFLYVQTDLNSRYWVHRVGPGTAWSVMGEIIGEKRLACQKSHCVARLISERMWTFIGKQGQPARGRNQLEKQAPPWAFTSTIKCLRFICWVMPFTNYLDFMQRWNDFSWRRRVLKCTA